MDKHILDDYFQEILPDPEIRQACLELLRDHILQAHALSPNSWVLFREHSHHKPVFLIKNIYTCSIQTDLNGNKTSSVLVFLNKDSLKDEERQKLKYLGCTFHEGFKNARHGEQVYIPTHPKENFFSGLEIIRDKYPEYLKRTIKENNKTSFPTLYEPEMVEYLRYSLRSNIPDPGYYTASEDQVQNPPTKESKMNLLQSYLSSKGYTFTSQQIAQFYTALQTKGFVILSGISGTGKTKLAQHFAGLLKQDKVALVGASSEPTDDSDFPKDVDEADWGTFPVRADVLGRLVPPFRLFIHYNNEIGHIFTVSEFQTQPGDKGMKTPWPEITKPEWRDEDHEKGKPEKKFKTWFRISHREKLEKKIKLQQLVSLFDYSNQPSALRGGFVPVIDPLETSSNTLFLSVRPDWRDSKGLLGYYNPLMRKYEWTSFLRFLLQAVKDYRQYGERSRCWFVILDEMNLARVEYYFSDLLSVLESGRDKQGWTNEPVRLTIPAEVENDRPPEEIRLPPNLYIIGTVNIDETTHAFSPKVLDRAFTMELTEADFETYPPSNLSQFNVTDEDRKAIREDFTHKGRFIYPDKGEISKYVEAHFQYRKRLQCLNELLRPHDLHFGYRVFDEIILFMISAEQNGLFADLGGNESAFDAAILMKVLPKFHGSRGKLEIPLISILSWCLNPDQPDSDLIRSLIQQADSDPALGALQQQPYRYPKTAERVRRMLASLYTTGFSAFG